MQMWELTLIWGDFVLSPNTMSHNVKQDPELDLTLLMVISYIYRIKPLKALLNFSCTSSYRYSSPMEITFFNVLESKAHIFLPV